MSNLKRSLLLCGLALMIAVSATRADDTEIYFESGAVAGDPQVMFYIEYTPNLASTVCTGVTAENMATSCPAMLPVQLYLAPNDLEDGTIDLFEMVRAALKRVLAGLGGLKVGLLMPHDADNNCAGPAATGCSGGGYILKGLTPLAAVPASFDPTSEAQLDALLAADTQKKALFDKLDALRSPQGGFSHSNQLKENYFELFRYLTGQGVYNGHNGWNDYATSSAYNLGNWYSTPADKKGHYDCVAGFTCDTAATTDEYNYYSSAAYQYEGDFARLPNGNYMSTALFKWDTTIESGGNYISPLADCSKIFVINVLDGGGTAQNDSDTAIEAPIASGGMGFNVSNNDPGFVQMVRWLHDKDLADGTINGLVLLDKQNVTSFFIAKQPQQVDAAASAGGTGTAIALTDDPQSVIDTIEDVFKQILSVSTTFVSASIPVNVFNRSEVLDNAYIALFQANENAQPEWVGNIKKLKLDIYRICQTFDTDGTTCLEYANELRMIDALDQEAVSNLDGRINGNALTFWTNPNGYDLSDNIDTDLEVSGRDGRSVNRGGAGQQIPGFILSSGAPGVVNWTNTSTGRRLFTVSGSSLIDINYANIATLWPSLYDPASSYSTGLWPTVYEGSGNVVSLSGNYAVDSNYYTQNPTVSDTSCKTSFHTGDSGTTTCFNTRYFTIGHLASNLVAYIRGFDVRDDDGDGVAWETRRWVTGDPLHSRPLPINYGARDGSEGYTVANPDIRIIGGSNDGFVRMIKNTNADGSESGREMWAFMPPAVMAIQKQLMDNAAAGTPIHPYGTDGPISAYVKDIDGNIDPADGDRAWVYFGLRRGGRSYYALDVTNPDSPSFKWQLDHNSSGFSELGYTFSQPVLREANWGSGSRPVMIVGGGYDLNKDIPAIGTNDSMGNAVYIIDADTGELVWKVTGSGVSSSNTFVHPDMVDSIPSEATAIDSDNDGNIDRIYVGDTGGSVWRIDITGTDRADWAASKILDLGRHYISDLANDRRFFHAPDLVPARDSLGVYHAVVIGSGNRAHPLQTHTTDVMYMYKDRNTGGPLPNDITTLNPEDLFDATDNCIQEVDVSCSATNEANLVNGWRLNLTEQGEKSLSAALTLRGVVYFSTYIPSTSASTFVSCGPNEGRGYLYAVALADARAALNYDTTNTVVVDDEVYELQIEDRKRALLSGGIPSENVYVAFRDEEGNEFAGVLSADLQAGTNLGPQQWQTYWFEQDK
jgi:type IV pilus assembly protein PilY1